MVDTVGNVPDGFISMAEIRRLAESEPEIVKKLALTILNLKKPTFKSEPKYVQYEHHGEQVWVRDDLKGKHREMCACFKCERFKPEDRDGNCPTANMLYAFCVANHMTTPVTECMAMVPIKPTEGEAEDGQS